MHPQSITDLIFFCCSEGENDEKDIEIENSELEDDREKERYVRMLVYTYKFCKWIAKNRHIDDTTAEKWKEWKMHFSIRIHK